MVCSRGPLGLWLCTFCSISIIISHIAPQFNCQTPTSKRASESGDKLARTTTGCNHRASPESAHEVSAEHQQARSQRHRMGQQQQPIRRRRLEASSRQDADAPPHQLHSAHTRQQRQYNQLQQQQQQHYQSIAARSAAMMMGNSQQQLDNSSEASQNLAGSLAPQAEEFSLAAGAQQSSPTGGDLQPAAGSPQQSLVLAPAEPRNLSLSSYTMLADARQHPVSPTPSATTTTSNPATSADSSAGAEGGPTSGALTLPTSTEQAATQVANTTPKLTADSLSAPEALQPAVTSTTSSTLVGAVSSKSQQQQQQQPAVRQQQARRMEDEPHPHPHSAGERHASGAQPISSSPSSVSIITPLAVPGQQQASLQVAPQQQSSLASSSMMKPIYVLGTPIGEIDYPLGSMSYEQPNKPINRTPSSSGARSEKRVDEAQQEPPGAGFQQQQQLDLQATGQPATVLNATLANADSLSLAGERMNGPALVYSDGRLVGVGQSDTSTVQVANASQPQAPSGGTEASEAPASSQPQQQQQQQQQKQVSAAPAEPRLFQGGVQANGAAVLNNNPRRPSLPPPVNQEKAASGFRSPLSPSGPLIGQPVSTGPSQALPSSSLLQQPVNSQLVPQMNSFYQASPPYGGNAAQLFAANMAGQQRQAQLQQQQDSLMTNKQAFVLGSQQQQQQQQSSLTTQLQLMQQQQTQLPPQAAISQQLQPAGHLAIPAPNGTNHQSRRPLNITRVEHISAECSNDLIRAVIVFNGTFKGIIYSSGYVNDPTCLYVNGSGLTRYEFSIRLNQCGTLGRQEMHQPAMPGEAKRRDQVMWNTLSIQYNSVIEQEWDEHFRVSCEYGSDFWKTISFSPFNVETNTGSPVVFTINPPQCQMDVLLGHGMGPKIAVDGPVTVGDPLTLLIHMKSEKAGYDILVKNCVAHNGGKQRMQLIDVNGCVVNERFISPFRGTYNDNDLRHVTLYAYLKAFRFTGSPVLYLECEIHMCQGACPPQMCYWRRLSKRSVDNSDFEYSAERSLNSSSPSGSAEQPVISDSLSLFKALQVRHEPSEPARARQRAQALREIYAEDDEAQLVCYRHAEVFVFMATLGSLFMLLLSVAITCFFRLRSVSQRHYRKFEHSRLTAGSLSPSLLSIGESLPASGAASVLSFGAGASDLDAPLKKSHKSRGAAPSQQIASRGEQQLSFNLSQPHRSPAPFGAYDR